ncbi:primosomal replication protein [Psychrosphaera sp. B3R10]|uniref:primosomal replication protein n=1 Tax=unclassified Psychrosphaera TaxID=2641570 RepID=UPI001C097962|nr:MULTISPECIES: primosomal replication protein [unclassified Psychrosphaera]MBU2883477.1 primosomal replication protein [Psychrosphaera sp. I2R16]MBU2990333.1 primosomal replication protein [Psychrosphaera sp. B3R10]
MNSSTNNYQILCQQFESLKEQLNAISILPEKWFAKNDLFNSTTFYTRSDELKDYVLELENNVKKLGSIQNVQLMEHLSVRVADQFSCFRGLLNSVVLNTKSKTYNATHRKQINKVKQFAKQARASSRSLYEELSKLQEFERRLVDMVAEKQQTLNKYSGQAQRQTLQDDVLVTHQRLGRCRQAISKIEEQIQKLDERQY